MQFGGVDLDPDSSTFWFAGKQLQPDKKLSDYLGRNEKTHAVVKLQKKGAEPPAREPVSHTLLLWAPHINLKYSPINIDRDAGGKAKQSKLPLPISLHPSLQRWCIFLPFVLSRWLMQTHRRPCLRGTTRSRKRRRCATVQHSSCRSSSPGPSCWLVKWAGTANCHALYNGIYDI